MEIIKYYNAGNTCNYYIKIIESFCEPFKIRYLFTTLITDKDNKTIMVNGISNNISIKMQLDILNYCINTYKKLYNRDITLCSFKEFNEKTGMLYEIKISRINCPIRVQFTFYFKGKKRLTKNSIIKSLIPTNLFYQTMGKYIKKGDTFNYVLLKNKECCDFKSIITDVIFKEGKYEQLLILNKKYGLNIIDNIINLICHYLYEISI